MDKKINDKIWLQMKKTKELPEADRELYLFGFTQGIILLLNIITSLCIGIMMNMLLEVIIYMSCFIPLRIYAGGYHAKTQLRCYVMSSITTVIVMYLSNILQRNSGLVEPIVNIISVCIIWSLAPVEDNNKMLSIEERLVYRKKVRSILTLLLMLAGLFYILKNNRVVSSIEIVFCFLALVLLLGQLKNKFVKQANREGS